MKTTYKIFLIIIFSLFFYSCEDFMDIHKQYIEDGEIIYAPKPDSIAFISGHNRILFRCWMYNGINVKTINVLWNDGMDSLSIPVTFKTEMDSLEIMLSDMPEKSYTFNVHSVDNFGHHSLIVTNFGSSYGDIYISSLTNRRIKGLSLTDKFGTIEWYSAPEGLIANKIKYIKKDGTVGIATMPATDNSINIDVKAGTKFEYRSLYIPEKESVDTFYTAWIEHPDPFPSTYLYDRSDWQVLEVSDETASDGGGMTTLIDGDLSTYWHSKWDPTAPLPHWAIIDMESPKKIAYVDIYRRKGNTDTKTVQLFVSNTTDPESTNWIKIGEGMFTTGDKLTIETDSDVQGQYLKIYLPDSNREPFTSIAEIYVYGN